MNKKQMKAVSPDLLEGQEVIRIGKEWCRVISTEKRSVGDGRISVSIHFSEISETDGSTHYVTAMSDRLFAFRMDMQTPMTARRLADCGNW